MAHWANASSGRVLRSNRGAAACRPNAVEDCPKKESNTSTSKRKGSVQGGGVTDFTKGEIVSSSLLNTGRDALPRRPSTVHYLSYY